MKYRTGLLISLALVIVGCGSGDDRDEYFNPSNETSETTDSSPPPRQSFVVRIDNRTGNAEYAVASFDPKTHPQNLADMAEGIKQWQPVQQNQVITSQSGYPSKGRRQLYFVRDPQSFQSQHVYPQVPGQQGQIPGQMPTQNSGITYSRNGIGYGNQGPSQLPSGPGYGGNYPTQLPSYGGNYPTQLPSGPNYGNYPSQLPSGPIYNSMLPQNYCNTMNYANCYGYLPATYTNAWVYWDPCYYYSADPYSYAFYTYGW